MSTSSGLTRIPKNTYGTNYDNSLLEQYKLYSQSADQISNRRATANNFLLSVNTSIVVIFSFFSGQIDPIKSKMFFLLPIVGILICIIWIVLLKSYKELNSAKFKCIHEIENLLPLAPYSREWEIVKESKTYKPFTFARVEPAIAIVFLLLYITLLAFRT
ncbi:MAG: hypothetical protein OEZ51_10910 [Nitrospinota bacterium]|nr:hypothetical protein [Nitrospinota bacterium]